LIHFYKRQRNQFQISSDIKIFDEQYWKMD